MSQASLEEVNKKFILSPRLYVQVNHYGQVQILFKPKEDFLEPGGITLSSKAWLSFLSHGREKVNKCLKSGGEVVFTYHPKTKCLRVRNDKQRGKQVSFLTYSRAGEEYKAECITLNEEEWGELDLIVPQINWCFEQMRRGQGEESAKTYLMRYRWQFSPLNEGDAVPRAYIQYLTEKHAREKGQEIKDQNADTLGPMTIYKDVTEPLNPVEFLLKVYLAVLYRGVDIFIHNICPGCINKEPPAHAMHRSLNGCQHPGRHPVKDFLPVVKHNIPSSMFIEVFQKCWKALQLPIVDCVSDLDKILLVIDDDMDFLKRKVFSIKTQMDVCPECMFIQDHVCDEAILDMLKPVAVRRRSNLPHSPMSPSCSDNEEDGLILDLSHKSSNLKKPLKGKLSIHSSEFDEDEPMPKKRTV